MHARTTEVLAALDRSHDALLRAVLRVPSALRETSPASGRWSAAQVVHHLALVETRIAGVVQGILAQARAGELGAETLTESAYGSLDWSRVADRTNARVASEASTPPDNADCTAALGTLTQHRAVIRSLLRDADGLALSAVIAPHPVMGDLTLYQWALFVATHESRHAAQVVEIAESLTRSTGPGANDPARALLRHALATVAYRVSKAVRTPPEKFGKFRAGPSSRSAVEIVAHMGDLFDWALTMAKGQTVWRSSEVMKWKPELERFFASLTTFDEYLASDAPLHATAEQLMQGPVADALTHTGQLTMMRRVAGGPVRGESYAKADIRVGSTGHEQPASLVEFD